MLFNNDDTTSHIILIAYAKSINHDTNAFADGRFRDILTELLHAADRAFYNLSVCELYIDRIACLEYALLVVPFKTSVSSPPSWKQSVIAI